MKELIILADRLEELLRAESTSGKYKNLTRIVTRAKQKCRQPQSYRQILMHVFGLDKEQGAAPFDLLGDGIHPGTDYCIHADPVSVYVDVARVFITRWGAPGLEREDWQQLSSRLAEHFRDEKMQMESPCAERWYLRMNQSPGPAFVAPESALGRDIGDLLAAAPEAGFWKTRLNESQMILHRSPVNERLISEGNPAINSLWFWGGGVLPETITQPQVSVVEGSDILLTGLAQWCNVPCMGNFADLLSQENASTGLTLLPFPDGEEAETTNHLEYCLGAAVGALKSGVIEKLSLVGNQLTFDLRLRDWRAIWRRRTLSDPADTSP